MVRSLARTAGCPLIKTLLEPSARYCGPECFHTRPYPLPAAMYPPQRRPRSAATFRCRTVRQQRATCRRNRQNFPVTVALGWRICGVSVPAARAAGRLLVSTLLEPVVILPAGDGGNSASPSPSAILLISSVTPAVSQYATNDPA